MGTFSYVEEFLHHLRAAGRSPCTLRNHRKALVAFTNWLSDQGKTEDEVSANDLVAFINTLVDRHAPGHVNHVVAALRVYFRWLQAEGLRRDGQNPAARLKFLRVPVKPIESLTDEECRKLVRWATHRAPRERFGTHRTAALALLLLDTGLRVGEALSLTVTDLDFAESKILVRKTKTREFRVVPLSPSLRKHLRRYLQRRDERLARLDARSEAVFLSESGKPCTVSVAEHSFQSIGKAAGIRPVYPHLLRHTFATQSLLNGAPLPAVMRLGGWRKLTTVQRYTYMNDTVAAEVHAKTSPLAKL